MSALAARIPAAFGRLSRRRDDRLVAGVCAGLADTARVDPTLVRLVFALLALAGGAGIVLYLGAWAALPEEPGREVPRWQRVSGIVLAVAATGLGLRAMGLADSVLWPALVVAIGVYIFQSAQALEPRRSRQRRLVGTILVVLGAVVFVARGDTQNALVAPTGLVIVLLLVVGPWMWRLGRERDLERLERIRAEERADMAARVHDSVLQTLTLLQRSADDPRRVAALARRQERELRAWLYGDAAASGAESLGRALEDALGEVEELHGVRVEIVQTGDAPLDEPLQALVLAAREAATNAATHSGVTDVSVYVEVGEGEVALYVRDRGRGFDPAAATERRGITDSIVGRLARYGGSASVQSAPGEGTEVELRLPRTETA